MKGHVDRSRGIGILITEAFAEINPTSPYGEINRQHTENETDLVYLKKKTGSSLSQGEKMEV